VLAIEVSTAATLCCSEKAEFLMAKVKGSYNLNLTPNEVPPSTGQTGLQRNGLKRLRL